MADQKAQKRRSFLIFGVALTCAAFAAMAYFVLLSSAKSTEKVLVVSNTAGIQAYHLITKDDVSIQEVSKHTLDQLSGTNRDAMYTKAEDAVGKYAIVPMAPGEVVMRFKVGEAKDGSYMAGLYGRPGMKLISFSVPLINATAGQLLPGDFMDVFSVDESTGKLVPLLSRVEVVDAKYGSNPFKSTGTSKDTAGTSSASTTGKTDPRSNTVNASLGDQAVFIVAINVSQVESLIPRLIKGDKLYVAATVPPELTGSSVSTATVNATGSPSATQPAGN